MPELTLPIPTLWALAFAGWSIAITGIVWFVRSVGNGKLYVESQHVRELTQANAATEAERTEKAMWRDTALSSLEAARLSNEQTGQMLEGLKTVEQLLRGLMAIRDKP